MLSIGSAGIELRAAAPEEGAKASSCSSNERRFLPRAYEVCGSAPSDIVDLWDK